MNRRTSKHVVSPRPIFQSNRRRKRIRLLLEPLEDRTMLSTLVVNNPTDGHLANEISLREAVAQANTDAVAGISDTITFDPGLGSQTITLSKSQLELSGAGTGTITIDGSSPSTPVTLEAGLESRLFQIDSGVHAVFTDLNFLGGNVIYGSAASHNGGAILNAGTLTLSNANITECSAQIGGAIENNGTLTVSNTTFSGDSGISYTSTVASGGAIDNSGTLVLSDSTLTNNSATDGGAVSNSGTLTIDNSTFSTNSATSGGAIDNTTGANVTIDGGYFYKNSARNGGALEDSSATVSLAGVSFSGNSAMYYGGAIDNHSGALAATNTTMSSNSAEYGGAINNAGATVTLLDSTLSGNTAYLNGGGIDNSGTLSLSDSTLVNNMAELSGGGIENDGGALSLGNTTLTANTASSSGGGINNNGGTLTLGNTIVAGNTGGYGSKTVDINGAITTDNGYNLLGTAVKNTTNDPTPGPGDVFSNSPGVTALGNYGGATETVGLVAGSPAIAAGNSSAANPATDQRGLPRRVNGSLDIGAFQTQPATLSFVTLGQTAYAGQPITVTVQLLDLDGNPVAAGSGGVTVSLSSSSSGVLFLDTTSNPLTGSTITIPQGATSASFEYEDKQAGTPTLTVTAPGFASVTQQETILPAPISATPTQDIVVGRVLSSYDVPDVQNNQNQLTITYTVYNEAADTETGVLLTTTLATGVTLVGSSVTLDGVTTTQLPDQSGQNLAWSLQPIQGYDRESVAVTVSLANPIPLQLDSGAQAFAMLDAGAVSASTIPATLSPTAVDPDLLASTPDANTTDPFIQEEAAALDYNAQNIFNFLQQNMTYNAYPGSLRGARGTLWSNAGNALDVASLGVALMRASGIPAQYVAGMLSPAQAQTLLLSMFPASYQTVGYIPAGTTVSTVSSIDQTIGTDGSSLQVETENHYWFEFNTGIGWVNADPLMAGATIGETFTTATGGFTQVPQNLENTTQVQLVAEIYNEADAALGLQAIGVSPLQDTTVLNQTFDDAYLVGRPLSFGNFVSQNGVGSLFLSVTNTYTPYIVIGDEALADSQLPDAIVGQQYQEFLTNFPLASEVLTGLFLNVILSGAGTTTQTFSRSLVDRIGFAARQNGSIGEINVSPSSPPVLNQDDIYTVNVLPSIQSISAAALVAERAITLYSSLAQAPTGSSSQEIAASSLTSDYLTHYSEYEIAQYLLDSDSEALNLENAFMVRAYFAEPRITVFTTGVDSVQQLLTLSIDLRTEQMQVLPYPGQIVEARLEFNFARGFLDSAFETAVIPAAIQGTQSLSSFLVLQQAENQGIPLILLSNANLSLMTSLNLPSDAKSRISEALQNGMLVLTPVEAVNVNGTPEVGWYEFNPTTGDMTGVLEDGGHQDDVEYFLVVDTTEIIEEEEFLIISRSIQVFKLTPVSTGVNYAGVFAAKLAFLEGVLHFHDTGGSTAISNLINLINPSYGDAADIFADAFLWILEAELIVLLSLGDPPAPSYISSIDIPNGKSPRNQTFIDRMIIAGTADGEVTGTDSTANLSLSGAVASSWISEATSEYTLSSLSSQAAEVEDGHGIAFGTGAVALNLRDGSPSVIAGTGDYTLTGVGTLSFYDSTKSSLAASGDWQNYTATVTGDVSITLTVPAGALTLNGLALPAGTYTITTDSATLSGSGTMSAPNFAGSATITTTDGTVNLGPGSGSLSVGGSPLDPEDETTLDGYSGTMTVSANGDGTDTVNLSGNAGNVLQVAISPSTFTTDQNTPITFATSIQTSLADTYNITANAPQGWTVTIDSSGNVTVTPAPGLQGGTYPIQIIAQSQTDPNLEAQTAVEVTIKPTQPGINFSVVSDPLFTVPYNGAQLPTAFRAQIQNLGPMADTYNVTFSNVPSGFTLEESATSDTVPAGDTGIVGLYLVPNAGQPLPAPGTQLSFDVTVTSATNPSITQTVIETFTVPAIDAVNVPTTPSVLSIAPGATATDTITLTNYGNVEEDNITLAATTSSGLTLTDLTPIASLAPGQSATEMITLTPDASTPLNSTLDATITATFGTSASPDTQSFDIPVDVVVPGATALVNAATAAATIGNSGLAEQLSNLSMSLTGLVQNPTSAVYLSESLAAITSIVSQVANDPFLASYTSAFTTASTALTNAASLDDINAALTQLGTAVGSLATTLTDEGAHAFTLSLLPSGGVALPQAATTYQVDIQNTGSVATTYDLAVSGLPAGVSGSFSQSSVTLQPGQSISGGSNGITLALTEAGDTLVPASFTVTVTAVTASEITQGVPGQLALRNESFLVAGVVTNPPFTSAGGQVDVSAKVQTVVNEPTQIQVSYVVTDANGDILFSSSAVNVSLTILSSLTTVDLGNLDTTGFAEGIDTITVTVADASGNPIPGATGVGSLTVGSPVTATLTVTPPIVPAGTPTVTNTLNVYRETPIPSPLSLEGTVTTTAPESSVALYEHYAYESGQGGINIIDVSDPTNPQIVGTFGQTVLVKGSLGFNVDKVVNGELIVATQNTLNTTLFNLLVYSLTDPLNPQLVSNTTVNYSFVADLLVNSTGTAAFVPLQAWDQGFGGLFQDQFGSFLSIDLTNPSQPQLGNVLFNDRGAPGGGDNPERGGVLVNDDLAYVASTTSSGGNWASGVGRLLIINTSDPNNLSLAGHLDIPGTVTLTDVAIFGNEALVVGNTGGQSGSIPNLQLSGNVTLTLLDITNPNAPTILGSTLVTSEKLAGNVVSLPDGEFLVGGTHLNGQPVLLQVDPSDPNNLVVATTDVPSDVNSMTVSGTTLYATTNQGLSIYDVSPMQETPVTVSVQVPNNTGVSIVANSFNVAPSQTITGTDYTTLVWQQTMAALDSNLTYTWQTKVSNLAVGETRTLALGASVAFTDEGTAGSLSLPSTSLTGVPIIQLVPSSQTVAPGGTAIFDVRLTNPTTSAVTYYVNFDSPTGYDIGWQFGTGVYTVNVGPQSSVDEPMTLTPASYISLGDYAFTVTASTYDSTATDTAAGDLIVAQAYVPDTEAHGVVVQLTPSQATLGVATSAQYVVQFTNTGSATEAFYPSVTGLPSGVYYRFSQDPVSLAPGPDNFQDVTLTISGSMVAQPGTFTFQVTATAVQESWVTDTATATLTVASNGVIVGLSPSPTTPGSILDMYVYNAGSVQDTFDLSLGGPAALVSTLAETQVTLAPGSFVNVPVTTGSVNFATQGDLELTATATSEGNSNVQNSASANLTIAPTVGMTAQFQQPTQLIPVPGTSDFLLLVNNTGNLQDSYSATITGTTGPVMASLVGLDGNPTQAIPEFILPGLSTGAIVLQTDLSSIGPGTVTVQVQSLSNAGETVSVTANVSAASTQLQPVIQLAADPGSTTTYGQAVTFTAMVSAPASNEPTPTGTVQFQIDGTAFGPPVALDSNGTATSGAISTLSAAGHTVSTVYSGDANYIQGSQTLAQTVNPVMPTVTVTAPNAPYDAAPYNALTSSVTGVNDDDLGAATSYTYYVGVGTGGTDLGSNPPTAAGTYTVIAGYAASGNYAAASSLAASFTITPLAITVTASSETKIYGTADPALGFQVTGGSLLGGDSLSGSLTRAAGENVGIYAIGQGTLTAGNNYDLTFVSSNLTITPASLLVTAGNLDINHGDAIPTPAYTISGLVNNDKAGVVSGTPVFSTPPNANNAAGVYAITPGQGTLAATNYTFQFAAGTLTVHPKVVDVEVQWGKETMSIMNLNRDLPFTDITAVDVTFSDNVTVTKSDLKMTGLNIPLYSFTNLQYNSALHEATWNLPTALGVDQFMLALDGTSSQGVRAAGSGIAMLNSMSLGFSVLPGDVDGDGVVTVLDAVDVMNDMAANQPYSIWADVDGDGVVDLNDYLAVRIRKGTKLP